MQINKFSENKSSDFFDICIIGAGIIGCAIARELAKYDLTTCLIEKSEDVATTTTKANSGIVHGGYAAKHGSLKAKLSAEGNALFQQLDNELHFGFNQTGSFVIGFNKKDAKVLQGLYENGLKNGVQGLQLVDAKFIHAKEPYISSHVTCALHCAAAGITSPYEFAIAMAENAIENGVTLKLNTKVTAIKKNQDHFAIRTNSGTIKAKRVINAAGLYADVIAKMVGVDSFTIKPRQGQYLLFDKDQAYLANSVIFQTPAKGSKGILVTPTFHDNLMIGPNSDFIAEKDDVDTTYEVMAKIIATAKKSIPDFNLRKVITSFAGNRATPDTGDFIIEETKLKGFINVAGIESPGLTSAPAIALMVKAIIEESGITIRNKKNFYPNRKPYKRVATMNPAELQKLIKQDPAYGHIICRCETISEGEIVDALRRPIPINSIDAIKRRTRAGMGRCQAGFCLPRVMEIIHRETGLKLEKICKRNLGTNLVVSRFNE